MPYTGNDFSPADPGALESATYSFDFRSGLGTGETISSVTWLVEVVSGTDPVPSSRLIGSSTISGTVVLQIVGTLLDGVKYRLTATVTTSAGQTLSAWSHVLCKAPS